MTTDTTRREMIKQVGTGAGALMLAPMLEQLAAHAAGDAKRVNRHRVIFVLQSNGLNPNHLRPSGIEPPKHGRLTNDELVEHALAGRTLHPAIEPLAPFLERMALVQGLSGRIAISDHSANVGALGACPANKGPMLQTIDSAVSDALPAIFSHVAIGYGGGTDPMNYSYSASGPGKAISTICSPDLAFKSLFGSVAEGSGRQAFDRRTKLLDFMTDDVQRAQSTLVGDERQKFDRYLEAFESLHRRQHALLAKADDLKKHAPKLGDKLTTSTSSLILEAQFEIAAAALVVGLTNVVTLISGGGGQRFGNFPEFGIPDLHHIVEPGERFQSPYAFLALFAGDWDDAGYVTQRFVEQALAKQVPKAVKFPFVSWDSWGYQQNIHETMLRRNAELAARMGRVYTLRDGALVLT